MSEEILGPPCLQCAEPMHFAKIARQGRGDAHFLRCLCCPVTVILTRVGYDEIRASFEGHARSNVVAQGDTEAVLDTTSAPPPTPPPLKPTEKSFLDEVFSWIA